MTRKRLIIFAVLLLPVIACSQLSAPEDELDSNVAESPVAADEVHATTNPPATVEPEDEEPLALTEARFISDEMCRELDGARSGESGVARGDDLHRITLEGENVVCNDGTPAVMYVKRAANPANETVWVFHLQGGGGCQSYEVCLIRWCGTENYDAGKMSSRWAPPSMRGRGLFLPNEVNPWHDVNQVFVYYCSSDGWTGRANDVIFEDPDDSSKRFRMHTRGHTIIEAVVEQLWQGAGSDSGQMSMPALSDASEVIFTGTSAGSGGVTHHLDWLAEQFDSAQTRVVGVMDAGSRPLPEDLGGSLESELVEFSMARVGYIAEIDAFLDQSCVEATAGDEIWRCGLGTWVHHNHLTTPFFIRMDLGDSLMVRDFVSLGGERVEIATATRERLSRLPQIGSTALEASSIDFVPGAYGPACGQHVGLTSGPWFLQTAVDDDEGTAWTFSDAIQAWYGGQSLVAIDTVPPTSSVCGDTTDARD